MLSEASPTHRRRATVLGVSAAALLAGLAVAILRAAWGRAAATATEVVPVEQAVATLAALGVGVVLLWLASLCGLGSIAAHCGGEPQRHGVLVGRWGARAGAVLLALTITSPSAQATPSSTAVMVAAPDTLTALTASPDTDRAPGSRSGQEADQDEGRRFPLPGWRSSDPPSSGTAETPPPTGEPGTAQAAGTTSTSIAVTTGDTLWDIAAADLGPEPSPQRIAAHWPRWYAENRHTIGPDPDLLRPGQVLHPPRQHCPGAERPARETS